MATRKKPSRRARIEAMLAEALTDAYGREEEETALLTVLEEELALPFDTTVLGVAVRVERVDLSLAGEIVAVCRRGRRLQRVPLLDLPLPKPPPKGAEWIAVYRRWARGSSG